MIFDIEKYVDINEFIYLYDIDNNEIRTCNVNNYVIKKINIHDEPVIDVVISDGYQNKYVYPANQIDLGVVYNGLVVFSSMEKIKEFKSTYINNVTLISTLKSIVLNLNMFVLQSEMKTIADIQIFLNNELPFDFVNKYVFISVDNNEPNDCECIFANNRYLQYIITGAYINSYREIIINAIPKEIMNNGCKE